LFRRLTGLLLNGSGEILQAIRSRVSRQKRVDRNTLGSDLLGKTLCEPVNPGPCHILAVEVWDRLLRTDRSDHDESAVTTAPGRLPERWKRIPGEIDRTHQVELQRASPVSRRKIIDETCRWTTGIRHKDVQS